MTADELLEISQAALDITGMPTWDTPYSAGASEQLDYLDDAEDAPLWALVPVDPGDDAYTPIGTALAADIIKSHLRSWLLDRGWQVQVSIFRGQHNWRLADCLSVSDGGGDRLDADYPHAPDQLTTLCQSVLLLRGT